MSAEQFEDDIAMAIDKALASLTKDDVILSLERIIRVIRVEATREQRERAYIEAMQRDPKLD